MALMMQNDSKSISTYRPWFSIGTDHSETIGRFISIRVGRVRNSGAIGRWRSLVGHPFLIRVISQLLLLGPSVGGSGALLWPLRFDSIQIAFVGELVPMISLQIRSGFSESWPSFLLEVSLRSSKQTLLTTSLLSWSLGSESSSGEDLLRLDDSTVLTPESMDWSCSRS